MADYEFLSRLKFQFAKTMANMPHWYTVRKPENEDDWLALSDAIRQWGRWGDFRGLALEDHQTPSMRPLFAERYIASRTSTARCPTGPGALFSVLRLRQRSTKTRSGSSQ